MCPPTGAPCVWGSGSEEGGGGGKGEGEGRGERGGGEVRECYLRMQGVLVHW